MASTIDKSTRELLEDVALMLEAYSPGSGSSESYAAEDIRVLLAAPAQPAAHVSVPRELLEWIESHLDRTTFAPFGEPLPPDNTERRELRDHIRALLSGGEA